MPQTQGKVQLPLFKSKSNIRSRALVVDKVGITVGMVEGIPVFARIIGVSVEVTLSSNKVGVVGGNVTEVPVDGKQPLIIIVMSNKITL